MLGFKVQLLPRMQEFLSVKKPKMCSRRYGAQWLAAYEELKTMQCRGTGIEWFINNQNITLTHVSTRILIMFAGKFPLWTVKSNVSQRLSKLLIF
jgi:hypothetical protein